MERGAANALKRGHGYDKKRIRRKGNFLRASQYWGVFVFQYPRIQLLRRNNNLGQQRPRDKDHIPARNSNKDTLRGSKALAKKEINANSRF